MSGKGTIQIDVQANTTKASAKIKALQKEVSASDTIKGMGEQLSNVPGLDIVSSQFGAIGDALGNVSKLANPVTIGLGAAAGAATLVATGLSDMVERGQAAAKVATDMETKLTRIAVNAGGAGAGIKSVTRELQLMSANGVNSMQAISGAVEILTVAMGGNVVKAAEMVKSFDDLAAGTGIQIDDWAEMASKVMNAGVSIKDLTKLSNKGIPVYQALGAAIGTTADEAQKMAKAGLVTTEQWLDMTKQLASNYAGISAAMSSRTLEGAQGTYQASRSMQYQTAAEARNDKMIDALNGLSDKIQQQLDDPKAQALNQAAGELVGSVDALGVVLKDAVSDLPITIAKGAYALGDAIDNAWRRLTGREQAPSAAVGVVEQRAFLPNLQNDEASINMFIEGKKVADIDGFIKDTEAAIKMAATGLASSDYSDEEKQRFAELKVEYESQLQALSKAREALQQMEDDAKAAEDAAKAQEQLEEAGKNAAAGLLALQKAADMASGDPERMMKAVLGVKELEASPQEYIEKMMGPLQRMLESGAGDEAMLQQYKELQKVSDTIAKQAESQANDLKRTMESAAQAVARQEASMTTVDD